jgi:hypothetical protein
MVRSSSAGVAAALLATAMVGCGGGGGDGPELYPVTGQVTFDGTPIEEGRILFRMTSGDGKAYSGAITDGAYEVQAEAGTAEVEITASRDTGKFDDMGGASEPVPIGEMYIPKQYNSETTLTKEIEATENEFNFELKAMP